MSAIFFVLQPLVRRFWQYGVIVVVMMLAYHFERLAAVNAEAVRTQAAQFRQSQADATLIARQAQLQAQAAFQRKATEADDVYKVQVAAARDAADHFINAHRVLAASIASAPRQANAVPESGSPPVSTKLPDDAVMVSSRDVRACTYAVTYAVIAHDWAMSINSD